MSLQYRTDSEKKKAKQKESNLLAFFIGLMILIMLGGGYVINSKKQLSKNNLEYLIYRDNIKDPKVIEASLGDTNPVGESKFKEIPEEDPGHVFETESKPSEEKKEKIDLNFLNNFICDDRFKSSSLLTHYDDFNKEHSEHIIIQYPSVVKDASVNKKMSNKDYKKFILKEYKRIYK